MTLHGLPGNFPSSRLHKVKQSHYRTRGFQEFEAPRFKDRWHVKVLRLLALRTGHLYSPGNIPGTRLLEAEPTPGL